MAPTIGRQWRGGTQDYAALCDYCDVRYLRSQLHRQSSGRLACLGPGTNSCGAGRDEIALDKINADKMRTRRRPTKHLGGRFDRTRGSIEEIFGETLREYWDANKGVVSSSDGVLASWTGQKLGAVLLPSSPGPSQALWFVNRPEFGGRPMVEVVTGSYETALTPFLAHGAKPYVAYVGTLPDASTPFRSGGFAFLAGATDGAELFNGGQGPEGQTDDDNSVIAIYRAISLGGTALVIPRLAIGNTSDSRLYEIDATEVVEFRAGKASTASIADGAAVGPWDRLVLNFGSATTLLVLADTPTAQQICEFQTLGRSYARTRP